ncbi:MAG: hypothetical protein GTO63_04450, partial [Anaerolineae bacterium]|nr:hypothetical protein [Anaerolineae bacterium]
MSSAYITRSVKRLSIAAVLLAFVMLAPIMQPVLAGQEIALHFGSPLVPGGERAIDISQADTTLLDLLTVQVWKVTDDSMNLVATITQSTRPPEHLHLGDPYYHGLWKPAKGMTGSFQVTVDVAGLSLGGETFTLTQRAGVPIKILIDNNPIIRAHALTVRGFSATAIADVLLEEFGLPAEETAQLLFNEGHSPEDVALALKLVYALLAEATASILRIVGYAAS